MTNISVEERIYNKMCLYCPNAKHCHEECENCEEYEQAVENYHSKKFDELTHQEKCEIYNMTQSSQHYLKEILIKFDITEHTHRRVINAFKTFLRTGKTDQM